jgi:NAD(P)-dependent dehydrogenase (short-subunit alcohol dehydrogenase family)
LTTTTLECLPSPAVVGELHVTWEPHGRIAVVVGASSGIGEAVARRLARAGMTVVAAARRRDRLEQLAREDERIVPRVVDVTDVASVDALARSVADELGACHALVNSAGIPGGVFVGRDDLDDALHVLDVNLAGTFRTMAAFADLLESSRPSRVVNVSSVAGKLGVGPAAYAASKFGQVGLSEATALSWARRGIVVCQLNPGFIDTEGFPKDRLRHGPLGWLVRAPDEVAREVHRVLRSGALERTVPGWYRPAIVLRHVVSPLYWAVARRTQRASGARR